MVVVLMLRRICRLSLFKVPSYLEMSVNFARKYSHTEPLQEGVSGHCKRQKHNPDKFFQNGNMFVCVSHPLSSSGQRIPTSKCHFSFPHTLHISSCTPHTWRGTRGKQRRMRRLWSPSYDTSHSPSYQCIICKEQMSSRASVKSSKHWQRWGLAQDAG